MAKATGPAVRARELIGFKRYAEAEAILRQALRREPDSAELHALMGDVLGYLGRVAESEPHVREAIRLDPRCAPYLQTLGDLLMMTGRRDEAAAAMESALDAAGRSPHAYITYATLMQHHWLLDRAVEIFERGLRDHPWNADLVSGLAIVLMKSGRPEETVELVREACRRHPDHPVLAAQLPFALNYPRGVEPEESIAAHRRYGALVAARCPAEAHTRPAPAAAAREAERRLRVGFVSADLRTHACSYFFESLLASLDRREFDTCCYSVHHTEDARTAELKRLSSMWRHCPDADPHALARRIRSDRIDILIDLSGLTEGCRAEAFALRPAPVQMTYLGYPNTTGLPTIDYRIVDSITDPPGAEAYATERLLRIDPCFLCYAGRPGARAQPLPPSQRTPDPAPITFGSFNALQKVNDPLMRLWARVIAAVPGSRLAVKYMSMGDQATRDRLRTRLVAAGVPDDRIALMPPTREHNDHLESYAAIDIGLDTFPYNGTTTTCEALWMGVPVVTLCALPFTHAARVGASLLSAVGLPDLAAPDEDAFVRAAAALAHDPARLRTLRETLRPRMLASPLGDRAAFGARFGAGLRRAWRQWCLPEADAL